MPADKPADEPPKNPTWKKRSILWNLPYWPSPEVRHSVDVMHVEKNMCNSILGTLLKMKDKMKDSVNARIATWEKLGIRKDLVLTKLGINEGRYKISSG